MTTADILTRLRPFVVDVLASDPWGQSIPLHEDRGTAPAQRAGGWAEMWVEIDFDTVSRRGLTHHATETDGRLVVVFHQPRALSRDQLDTVADALVSRLRGQCLTGLYIDQIVPGSSAASDTHSGYRDRMVVVIFTAHDTQEVTP